MNASANINRNYKDRLFRFLFNDKENLLELYNAVNDTDYDNPKDLSITTKDNVIYMTMKNDLSFLISGEMNLYEHQSSWNPNMPLRNFFYITDLYKGYVNQNHLDPYSSRTLEIPLPQAVVFYNGLQEEPERQVLKLSDSFKIKDKEGCVELYTLVLNINYGKNQKLMSRCRRLLDYAKLIEKIRRYNQKYPIEESVEKAIEECLKEGILADFLSKHRGEVTTMILEEYDEQAHIENEKQISLERGFECGKAYGLQEGRESGLQDGITAMGQLCQYLLKDGREKELTQAIENEDIRKTLFEEYSIKGHS